MTMPISKTCQPCAHSKVRCVRDPDAQSCNRCSRLGKECIYRQTGRRFDGFKKDKRIESLESRVNELMMADRVSPMTSPGVSSTNTEDVIDRGIVSMEAAESFLHAFKTTMTPHFPFVVIPPQTTAADLRQDKPFLFLAVLASASYANLALQRLLGVEVKRAIAGRMVMDGEVSFELLQGVLVYLAWCHYHKRPHRYTQFLQLAIGLLIELRLDRPPQTKSWKTPLQFKTKDTDEDVYTRPSWGRDEQRALAGCYYLSSTISVLVQKPSTFPNISTYLEECCKSLYDSAQYPHDQYILHIVHLQVIAEKIERLSLKHGAEMKSSGSAAELYITSIKSDLEAFRGRLPFNLSDIPFLAMQYHATELCLYQLSMLRPPDQHQPSDWQDEMSVSALVAAESMFKLYLALPYASELGFSNTQWVQMGFSMLVACRQVIATIRADQLAVLPYRISWLHTLTQLQQRVGALSTSQVDLNGGRDVFADFAKRVARVQARFDKPGQAETHTADDPRLLARHPVDMVNTGGLEEMPLTFDPTLAGGYQLPDDFFLTVSLDQMMGDWI